MNSSKLRLRDRLRRPALRLQAAARISLFVAMAFAVLLPAVELIAQVKATTGKDKGKAKAKAAPLPKSEDAIKPQEKSLKTQDDWQIAATYYQSTKGPESPVVILLHGRQGNRVVWDARLARRLQAEGYAVVSVDLRKHGQSQNGSGEQKGAGSKLKPDDYQRMVAQDLEAVKDFLLKEHGKSKLNVRKTAIVAPEFSAPIAMSFAVKDWLKPPYDDAPTEEDRTPRGQDIRALVFLSPELSLVGLPTQKVIAQLRDPAWKIAFMTIYGAGDHLDKGDAKKLYQKLTVLTDKDDRNYLKVFPPALRGTALLDADPDVEVQILAFLKVHLMGLEGNWKDRTTAIKK